MAHTEEQKVLFFVHLPVGKGQQQLSSARKQAPCGAGPAAVVPHNSGTVPPADVAAQVKRGLQWLSRQPQP